MNKTNNCTRHLLLAAVVAGGLGALGSGPAAAATPDELEAAVQKIDRALYGQYGGRVIFQQGGPEPLDAYRRFLEERKETGAFAIVDKAFEAKFWDYYRNDAIHSFYPPGSEEEKMAFDTPWWLQDAPQE